MPFTPTTSSKITRGLSPKLSQIKFLKPKYVPFHLSLLKNIHQLLHSLNVPLAMLQAEVIPGHTSLLAQVLTPKGTCKGASRKIVLTIASVLALLALKLNVYTLHCFEG